MCYLCSQGGAQLLHSCHRVSPVNQGWLFMSLWEEKAWGGIRMLILRSGTAHGLWKLLNKHPKALKKSLHMYCSFGCETRSLLSLALELLLWFRHHFKISLLPLTISDPQWGILTYLKSQYDRSGTGQKVLDNWTRYIFASLPLLRPDEITIPFGPVDSPELPKFSSVHESALCQGWIWGPGFSLWRM